MFYLTPGILSRGSWDFDSISWLFLMWETILIHFIDLIRICYFTYLDNFLSFILIALLLCKFISAIILYLGYVYFKFSISIIISSYLIKK